MYQKMQWMVTATALAAGVLLSAAAGPAEAQLRIRLTSPVTGHLQTGIRYGITIPPSSPTAPTSSSQQTSSSQPTSSAATPAPAPIVSSPAPVASSPAPVVPPPAPVVAPPAPVSQPVVTPTPVPVVRTPAPVVQPAPQGFGAGPGILGQPRQQLGHMVDRVAPDLNGDGWPDIAKHHSSR